MLVQNEKEKDLLKTRFGIDSIVKNVDEEALLKEFNEDKTKYFAMLRHVRLVFYYIISFLDFSR